MKGVTVHVPVRLVKVMPGCMADIADIMKTEIIFCISSALLSAHVFVLLLLKANISKLFQVGHFSPGQTHRFGTPLI